MRFDELMQGLRPQTGEWIGTAGDDWLQGRSLFGGLQVSLALRAMRALVPADVPLRSLQASFVAPVPAGAVRVRAGLLRSGRSATHAEARLLDAAQQTQCIVIGIFGSRRPSAVNVVPRQPPVPRPPDFVEMPYVPGLVPAFFQHFSMRWLRGAWPYSGADSAEAVIEVGLREGGAASELHLPAIADAIPPLALALLKSPAPGSSMTWMLELLADRWEHQMLHAWRFDAEVVAARDGYTSQQAMIWAPDGTPAMLSRQNMVVFG